MKNIEYQKPSYEEICKRVSNLKFFIGTLIYLLSAFGGLYFFNKIVQDYTWQEIFLQLWWIPSGAFSWYVAHMTTSWLIAWIPKERASKE